MLTNPIDSLPATPETVGMPQDVDLAWCHRCRAKSPVSSRDLDLPFCWLCRSYDVEKVKS